MNELAQLLRAAGPDFPVVVVSIICAFVAGAVCGLAWKERSRETADDDAGDTHAHLHIALDPFEPATRQCRETTRRVRAGKAPLPYSFDSRKAANPAAPPSPPPAR